MNDSTKPPTKVNFYNLVITRYFYNHILEKIPRISFTQMNDIPKVKKYMKEFITAKTVMENVCAYIKYGDWLRFAV